LVGGELIELAFIVVLFGGVGGKGFEAVEFAFAFVHSHDGADERVEFGAGKRVAGLRRFGDGFTFGLRIGRVGGFGLGLGIVFGVASCDDFFKEGTQHGQVGLLLGPDPVVCFGPEGVVGGRGGMSTIELVREGVECPAGRTILALLRVGGKGGVKIGGSVF